MRKLTQREQEALARARASWSCVIIRLNGELITRDVPVHTASHLLTHNAATLAEGA